MKSSKLLFTGISISILIYLSAIVFELEIFEGIIETMVLFEDYEFDEVIFPIMVLSVFLVLYIVQFRREIRFERELSKVYILTISSMLRQLNSCLNHIEKMKLNKDEPTTETDLIVLEESIREVLKTLNKLRDSKEIEELKNREAYKK